MMLDLPFYKNNEEGTQCSQVTMKTAVKYYLDKDISIEDLDQLTGRKGNFYTWSTQTVVGLYKLGLKAVNFSIDKLENYLEGEKYIYKYFSEEDAESIIETTDFDALYKSIEICLKCNLYRRRNLTLKEIEEHIRKNHIVIVQADWNILHNEDGPMDGHAFVLTGFDSNYFYYHESGPDYTEANKKITKEKFLKAAHIGKKYEDIIVVYGKLIK